MKPSTTPLPPLPLALRKPLRLPQPRQGYTTAVLAKASDDALVETMRAIQEAPNVDLDTRHPWWVALRALLIERTAVRYGWAAAKTGFSIHALAADKTWKHREHELPEYLLTLDHKVCFRDGRKPAGLAVQLYGAERAIPAVHDLACRLGLQAVLGAVPAWHFPGRAVPILYRPVPRGERPGFIVPKLHGAT